MFINLDEILSVSIGPMTFYHKYVVAQRSSWPWRNIFSCGKLLVAKKVAKNKKTWFSTRQVVFSPKSMGLCWLKSLLMLRPSEQWNSKNGLCFCQNISIFFLMSFDDIFYGFCELFVTSSRLFFHLLYLGAQEKYRYIFVLYVVASAERNFLESFGQNFLTTERLARKIKDAVF